MNTKDAIVGVNGNRGSSQKMVEAILSSPRLEITLRRFVREMPVSASVATTAAASSSDSSAGSAMMPAEREAVGSSLLDFAEDPAPVVNKGGMDDFADFTDLLGLEEQAVAAAIPSHAPRTVLAPPPTSPTALAPPPTSPTALAPPPRPLVGVGSGGYGNSQLVS